MKRGDALDAIMPAAIEGKGLVYILCRYDDGVVRVTRPNRINVFRTGFCTAIVAGRDGS